MNDSAPTGTRPGHTEPERRFHWIRNHWRFRRNGRDAGIRHGFPVDRVSDRRRLKYQKVREATFLIGNRIYTVQVRFWLYLSAQAFWGVQVWFYPL